MTKIPEPIDGEKIKKQRQLEQKQRALEKKVRKFKRLEAGTQSPEIAAAYRKELREAQQELKAFVDEHNDVLRRDYSREKVYGAEDLTNERNRRILKEKIVNGELTLTLNPEKQNFHIHSSEAYNPAKNKSYFDVSIEELQEIINSNYAKGKVRIKSDGQIKEIISLPQDIGTVVDEYGVIIGKTNRIIVHYSKKRTHVVPAERKNTDET